MSETGAAASGRGDGPRTDTSGPSPARALLPAPSHAYLGPLDASAFPSTASDARLAPGTTLVLPLIAVPGLCPAPGPGSAFPLRPTSPGDAAALAAALAAPPPATGLVAVYAAAGSASGRGLDASSSSDDDDGGPLLAGVPTPGRRGPAGRPAIAFPWVGVSAAVSALAPPDRAPLRPGRPPRPPAAALLVPCQRLALLRAVEGGGGGAADPPAATSPPASPGPPPAAALCVVLGSGDAPVHPAALAGGAAAPAWVWRRVNAAAALRSARAELRAAAATAAAAGDGAADLLERAACALEAAGDPSTAADALQAALPLASADAAALATLPATAPRLRALAAAALATAGAAGGPPLACRTCGAVWGAATDAIPPPSATGAGGGAAGAPAPLRPPPPSSVSSTHTNAYGHVHALLTARDAASFGASLVLEDASPTAAGSWFPGWGWTIAYCGACASHAGWRFDALPAGGGGGGGTPDLPALSPLLHGPPRFWGLRRAALADCVPHHGGDATRPPPRPASSAGRRPRVRRSLGLEMAV